MYNRDGVCLLRGTVFLKESAPWLRQSVACHSRRPGSIPSQSMCDLWLTDVHSDWFLCHVVRIIPVSIPPPLLHTLLHVHFARSKRQTDIVWAQSKTRWCCWNLRALNRNSLVFLAFKVFCEAVVVSGRFIVHINYTEVRAWRAAEVEGSAGCDPKRLWWKPFMGCRPSREAVADVRQCRSSAPSPGANRLQGCPDCLFGCWSVTNRATFSPQRLYLCVVCGSENKQQLFPNTALTDWFV